MFVGLRTIFCRTMTGLVVEPVQCRRLYDQEGRPVVVLADEGEGLHRTLGWTTAPERARPHTWTRPTRTFSAPRSARYGASGRRCQLCRRTTASASCSTATRGSSTNFRDFRLSTDNPTSSNRYASGSRRMPRMDCSGTSARTTGIHTSVLRFSDNAF